MKKRLSKRELYWRLAMLESGCNRGYGITGCCGCVVQKCCREDKAELRRLVRERKK